MIFELELPDAILLEAQAKAARLGITLDELVARAVRTEIDTEPDAEAIAAD
ncbi:hypothetical protein [Haloferula sargassicola]|uniref:Toxin-antitoxin system HicB family antitoxin n=1 Tax=Haloferula sargassicola TaxID=490096 RepID=A0ABP9UMF8_9BACT